MKKLFLVANWKSNHTLSETRSWFDTFSQRTEAGSPPDAKIVITCLPYVYLSFAKQTIQELGLALSLGAQDISPFSMGAYTGEVTGQQIKDYADYTIIGHSERREYFGENDTLLEKKVAMAVAAGLIPIFCVQGKDTPIPDAVTIVAYEPISAIGTGTPDTPESAEAVAQAIKETHRMVRTVLYGGSVKPENVASFTALEHIDGVLVGGASLHAEIFSELIHNT